eukprot:TRINITY_DN1020_c0_g1_i2.p1 TRINITY_DN1020_c0_g1~~TRINITY_DN1020_c0_g1_i2.p1  ORF type:complete len:637 (+),score=218.05 TRINITY_DN1020_c0_g1_i2:360-2270(+)
MSSGRINNHQNMVDQDDTDLSFEALTFGGGSNDKDDTSPTESPVQRKENKDMGGFSSKSPITVRSPVLLEQEKERGTTSVYISTQGENKIDVPSLLKRVELFGTVKAHYFREKQNFGFVQFLDAGCVDAVIDDLNKNGVDGVSILAEKAVQVSKTTGRASPTSVGGTPFSPSTPITPSVHMSHLLGGGHLLSSTPNGTPLFQANNSSLLPPVGSSGGVVVVGPEKPDTILVLKNLPFSLKQDQLQEILMQMNSNAPQSINLHFDNLGVFRGMAFIKYRNLDDAIKVYDNLNGYDVGGRKVRVEYKRKNKGQPSDVPQEWIDDEDLRKLWEQVKEFSANPNIHEVSLNSHLTPSQRKQIHAMADKLKLSHFSNGEGEQRHICLKKSSSPSPIMSSSSSSSQHHHYLSSPHTNGSHPMSSSSIGGGGNMSGQAHMMMMNNGGASSYGHGGSGNGGGAPTTPTHQHQHMNGTPSSNNGQYLSVDGNRGIEIKGRRRQNSDAIKICSPSNNNGGGSYNGGSSVEKYNNNNRSGSVSSGSYSKKDSGFTPSDNHDWRSPPPASPTSNQAPTQPFTSPSSSSAASPLVSSSAVAPVRQPKGPDGSKGFTEIYKESRKSCGTQMAQVEVTPPDVLVSSASVST